jgi:hypothetical protein
MTFKPGVSGNPNGRPKGSRHKISEFFLRDLHALWEKKGRSILERAAQESPSALVKVVAGLLPRDVVIHRPEQDMTDDELLAALEAVRQWRAAALAADSGRDGSDAPGGDRAADLLQ